jgi:rubrerythrin
LNLLNDVSIQQSEEKMASIKGTETEKNLLKAFAGESQATNRYLLFAKEARKEGYEKIAALFEETAENEQYHARSFFRFLEGGMVEITASYPAGVVGNTKENLRASAAGENEEHTELYPHFAQVAEEEGFKNVASAFRMIAKVEEAHETRFLALLEHIENDSYFSRDKVVKWKCMKCGYVHEGKTPPEKCPACGHPSGWFEVMADM